MRRKYYVASAWWLDSDPFITIVSTTAKKTEKAIMRAMREEARSAYDSMLYDRVSDALDDIAWSGIFEENRDTIERDILRDYQLRELDKEGIVYANPRGGTIMNPRRLGRRTPRSEMEKYGPAWRVNPPPDWKVTALHKKGMTPGQIARELGTTSTYVEGTLARLSNPRKVGKYVEARLAFKYAHETIIPAEKVPKDAVIRSITTGDHILRIASWGKVAGKTARGMPKHAISKVQSILHPREEGKACAFMASLRKTGRLKELLEKGRLPVRANITPWSGGSVQYLPCPNCEAMNPVSVANVFLKCKGCGMPLKSVRVRRDRRK